MGYIQVNHSPELYSIKLNEPVMLDNPETLWVVQSGKLAVFATSIQDGSPVGRRRYLFNVSVNAALFGAALLPEIMVSGQSGLMAVAIEATKLSSLSMADFIEQIAASDPNAIELLEGWIYHLGQTLSFEQIVLTAPLNIVQAESSGNLSLSSGEALQLLHKTLFWVKLQQGNTFWMGVEELKLNSASPVFPVTHTMWLEAENSVTGIMLPTAELEHIDELCASLASLHTYFFCYLNLVVNKEVEAEYRQFIERKQLNRQVVVGALGELAEVWSPEQETGFFEEGTPLLVALGAVGRALEVQIHPPSSEELNRIKDPVAEIARSSQIRSRRVKLSDGWWHKDQGPLLGYSLDNLPVALLPVKDGYIIFDPVTRTRTSVNKSVANTLLPSAHILYRPLPKIAHNAIELLQFATKDDQKNIASMIGLGVMGTVLGMIAPQATAILVNYAIPNSDRILLWQIGLVLFAVAFGQLAFQITQSIITLRVETVTDSVLQPAIWDRLLRLNPGFFRQYTSGDLVNRVMSVRQIHKKLSGATQRTLLSGVFALLNLVLMFVYSWQLAFVGLGLAIFAAAVTTISSFRLVKKLRRQQELDGEIQGLTVQLINGVAKLRVSMAEERAFAAWAKKYSQQVRLKTSIQQISDRVSVFNEALPLVSSVILFGYAGLLLTTHLSVGVFLAFNYALTIFIKGVIDLSNTVTDIWGIVPLWERAQPILRSPLEFESTKENPGQLSGRIVLEHVSFRYSENGSLILNDISLHAEPGEFIAIVGASGSGKSTIFRLLLGFETPLAGSVYYDGKDLAGLDIQSVRRMLGVVLQNGKIGSGSIFDSITAGALISLDVAWEAAQMAGFAEDIQLLPMGMHTVISEGGSNLSGGQRQRLLIARSLVSKPKIILMDEATSALDNQTQEIVTDSLNRLNVTRIVIAHRLSTIRNADRIYVMETGRIVQVGTFSELIAQEGLFVRLVARQME